MENHNWTNRKKNKAKVIKQKTNLYINWFFVDYLRLLLFDIPFHLQNIIHNQSFNEQIIHSTFLLNFIQKERLSNTKYSIEKNEVFEQRFWQVIFKTIFTHILFLFNYFSLDWVENIFVLVWCMMCHKEYPLL